MKKVKQKQYRTLTELHTKFAKDEAYKKAYDDLDLEFSLIQAIINGRTKSGMTQKDLAEKVGTKQSSIARFESGSYNPTLSFVQKLARALNVKIRIA